MGPVKPVVEYAVIFPVTQEAWDSVADLATDLRYEASKQMQQKGTIVSDIKMDITESDILNPAMAAMHTWDGREIFSPPELVVRFRAELIPNEQGLKELEAARG